MQVVDFLGSAAFSKAVQAIDLKNGGLVCLKIVKVPNGPSYCSRDASTLSSTAAAASSVMAAKRWTLC
jgi:hypothetical protein